MTEPFSPADVQLEHRAGIIDFAAGHPPAELLPAAGLARAASAVFAVDGPSALGYGRNRGPAALIDPLADWLARHGDPLPAGAAIFITGGVSQGLDQLCTLYTAPGDVILVESPVYHLALRVFRDHRLELVGVSADAEGLRPDALRDVLAAQQKIGRRPRFLYTAPTYNNPTGYTAPLARRREIAQVASEAGLTILEDDVYRHLWFDTPPPPPIQAVAPLGAVIRLGSFSKLIAPGLRLGWLIAAPAVVRDLADSGLLDSGGGQSHTMAHVAGAYIGLGLLDEQADALRTAYRHRRDALLAALETHLAASCTWTRPEGGFFIWLTLPPGIDSAAFLAVAEAAGVSYVPGARFCCCGGGDRCARLAFTLLRVPQMQAGVRRLAAALLGETAAAG